MIPAPYDFKDIDRYTCMHPSVEAEIAAAREPLSCRRSRRSYAG